MGCERESHHVLSLYNLYNTHMLEALQVAKRHSVSHVVNGELRMWLDLVLIDCARYLDTKKRKLPRAHQRMGDGNNIYVGGGCSTFIWDCNILQ
jgi:hypothetical protein